MTTEFIELAGSGAPEVVTGAFGSLNAQQGLLTDIRVSQDTLRTLAEETGGFAAVNTNDLSSAFGRIVDANSRYYVLGYYPPTQARDGRFHRIEVRVKRPGLQVRSRRGYLAPRGNVRKEAAAKPSGTAATAVATALSSPLPVKGWRWWRACSRASSTKSVCATRDTRQPTMRRAKASMTKAT